MNKPGHKRLLMLGAFAFFLQSCVSYQPVSHETIRSDEYYAEHEEYQTAYDEYAPQVYDPRLNAPRFRFSFADASFYPWWSVDYFYLGPHYYRPTYWAGPRYSMGYRYGFPPNYWSYYGFYSPFYYPYATYAWYDPWTGWPRYGIGTNFFWHEIYWASRNPNWSRTRNREPENSNYGNSLYESYNDYGDAFNDPRDRGTSGPISRGSLATTPGTQTGNMQVRRRADVKVRESRTGIPATAPRTPGATRSSPRPQARPQVTTPRPSSAPRPDSSSKAPDYQPGKKRKN